MNEQETARDAARLLRAAAEAPVEPDAGARGRVWRRLNNPAHGQGRVTAGVLASAAVAAAAAIALAVVITRAPEPELGEIAAMSGSVEAAGSAGAFRPARIGERLGPGAEIRTPGGAQSTLRLLSVGEIDVGAGSDLRLVRGTDHGLRVELARGSVRSRVAPRKGQTPFRVVAGRWTVTVVGTVFDVRHDAAGEVLVSVAEGIVEVSSGAIVRRLQAGERFDSAMPEPAAPQAALQARRENVVASQVAEETPRGPYEAPPAPATSEQLIARHVRRAPAPSARAPDMDPPSPSPELALVRAAVDEDPTPAIPLVTRAGLQPSVPPPPAPAASPPAAPAPPPPPAPATDDDSAMYQRALAFQDPAVQVATLDALAARGGPFAEVASSRAVRIVMARGRFDEAERRLADIITRFPNGALDREARLDLIECRIRLGAYDTARRDLEAYLLRYPAGERAAELENLHAQLSKRAAQKD